MTQTIAQYVAAVKRCKAAPADLRHQTQAWPYPQASQSHIAFWRDSWPHDAARLPLRQVRVPIIDSDCEGVLMRVAAEAPLPRDLAAALADD